MGPPSPRPAARLRQRPTAAGSGRSPPTTTARSHWIRPRAARSPPRADSLISQCQPSSGGWWRPSPLGMGACGGWPPLDLERAGPAWRPEREGKVRRTVWRERGKVRLGEGGEGGLGFFFFIELFSAIGFVWAWSINRGGSFTSEDRTINLGSYFNGDCLG